MVSLSFPQSKMLPPPKHNQATKCFFVSRVHNSSSLFNSCTNAGSVSDFSIGHHNIIWVWGTICRWPLDLWFPPFWQKTVGTTTCAHYLPLQLWTFLVNPLPYHTHTQKIWQLWGGVSLEVRKPKWKEKHKVKITFIRSAWLLCRHIKLRTYWHR